MVFGHVKSGQDIVQKIEDLKVDANSKPFAEVTIAKCGELMLKVKEKGRSRDSMN